ncbi:hypothetical protein FVEN_g2496 [Fusarium venenatum]|nr:hypothetical protein FVEN_g2496 [Fusarium venenatum]
MNPFRHISNAIHLWMKKRHVYGTTRVPALPPLKLSRMDREAELQRADAQVQDLLERSSSSTEPMALHSALLKAMYLRGIQHDQRLAALTKLSVICGLLSFGWAYGDDCKSIWDY